MAWQPTGIAADPRAAPSHAVALPGAVVLIVPSSGRWYAIEDRCSHSGCRFSEDGEIDGVTAICDCHGSEFDVRDGSVLVGPAAVPLPTYPVRERDGLLEVDL